MPKFTLPKTKLSLANTPTPIRPLDRLSKLLGGPRIWLKQDDLTGSVLSGNKIRKLEFTLAKALDEGADTVITCGAIQSNHCRATALAASQLGLKCHLILRGDHTQPLDGNRVLDYLAGAKISYYPETGFAQNLQSRFDFWQTHYKNQGHCAWCIPTGASDEIGIWGYICASLELTQDFTHLNIQPASVILATGSGGTQAGLTLGFALQESKVEVLGMAVCDNQAYFSRKVKQDIQQCFSAYRSHFNVASSFIDNIHVHTNDHYIGPGYAQPYSEVLEAIQLLASKEGVVLEPCYTGKAFYGLMQEIKAGRWKTTDDVVFLHTGGMFGLYPYKNQFTFS